LTMARGDWRCFRHFDEMLRLSSHGAVRILVDYRPALRARTGVGEYVHEIIRAYTAAHDDDVAAFTSSWRDRPPPGTADILRARVVDRRVPVRVLNFLWHRLAWPPVETLAGPFDVVHAAHPLLIPSRGAARVVTIHDLDFLDHPERTTAEIRRDYPALAARHARTAEAIVTSTAYGKALVVDRLEVPAERVYVCPFGAPSWRTLGHQPNVPDNGYFLFIGTLGPRKNLQTLLDAYEAVRAADPASPRLVIAGAAGPEATPWLSRIAAAPLAGHVQHLGYVPDADREGLYGGARALILPSFDEGFGVPALEAMAAGVPVIASNRGALPEVIGEGGTLLEPQDVHAFAAAMQRVACDDSWAASQGAAGLARAASFTWRATALHLRQAYVDAVARVRRSGRTPASGIA
jgi:glycosyltransferase involved in cell wall biosynthesis